MTREELEHIIRASADVTDQYEFIIVGSQSILGPVPNPPEVFTMSAEADIYPLQAPELADRIDGAIGEGSQFHQTYGYYAQGVGPETAVLPRGWITGCKAPRRIIAWATALICRTCSCPRPQPGAIRTASSAWQCSRIAT
jgi:hypothetical protein